MEEKVPLAYGQPHYSTKNFENMYEYDLCAETEDSEKIYLYAYCGPTGPAIGGSSDSELVAEAARALAAYFFRYIFPKYSIGKDNVPDAINSVFYSTKPSKNDALKEF